MVQLIVNGTTLPETRGDKYKCYAKTKSEQLRMISGRMVEEEGYTVQVIEYSFDYLPDSVMRPLLAAMRGSADIDVMYLPDNNRELQRGLFKCTQQPVPLYAFSRNGIPFWHNVSFTLEEANPSD